MTRQTAFGQPGNGATWCSSHKDTLTTGVWGGRVWIACGHGIVNEVFWPNLGRPQIRDIGFIVAGNGRWFELKRCHQYELSTPSPGIPLPTFVHRGPDYRVELEIVPDSHCDAFLIRYALQGDGYKLYALLAPHLGEDLNANSAWIEQHEFLARQGDHALCLTCDPPSLRASVGYVGQSDGWQDFAQHTEMTWEFTDAPDGNVAICAELAGTAGVLAVGLSDSTTGATTLARSVLAEGIDTVREVTTRGWARWMESVKIPKLGKHLEETALRSATVLKMCDDKQYPGAVIASPSIPWGNTRGDRFGTVGGYHLVWARDAVHCGLAFQALQHASETRRMLAYLIATQQPDGHWVQNFRPSGEPYWTGIQLDEAAFPVVLAARMKEDGQLKAMPGVTQMVERAIRFMVRCGPVTPQDRWEELRGISISTLAVTIAALVAGSDFLTATDRAYVLSYADYLNSRLEDWLYVEDTDLAKRYGVEGYYLRAATESVFRGDHGEIEIANRGGLRLPAVDVVSLDFLHLVRFGLRAPDDPRIRDTLHVCSEELKYQTPAGPAFRRYTADGYGETADGGAFQGCGIGRPWPLLTGERGVFAVQCGEDPKPWLEAMAAMTGSGNLLPEQIWDGDPMPEKGLQPGQPTGSATPLLWAHAEFLKLASAADAGVVERLQAVVGRYHLQRPAAGTWHWRIDAPCSQIPPDVDLLVEHDAEFRLHTGVDGWQQATDLDSTPLGLGMHGVRLPAQLRRAERTLEFKFYHKPQGTWEREDHTLEIAAGASPARLSAASA